MRQKMLVMSGYGLLRFEDEDRTTAIYENKFTGRLIRLWVETGEYEVLPEVC